MVAPNTPVLVGVGQVMEKPEDLDKAGSPLDLMEQASRIALQDAGLGSAVLGQLDVLAVVRSFREPTRNSAESLANRLGATQAEQWMMPNGGNGPQYLVNRYSEAITRGELKLALFSGAEAMDTGRRLVKAGIEPQWSEPAEHDRQYLTRDREMTNAHEQAHGFVLPVHIYPLYENALRHHYGHDIETHQRAMGELFEKFTKVAAKSPHAWYPIERSADEIATATERNRYVGWPYTKYMNAMNQINQSASLLLTSVENARALGIDESKWVYLNGCADISEVWWVSEREHYHGSRAIRIMGERTLAMAGLSIDEIAHLDIYSCFPSAVQIARDEFGIAPDDPRDLTITGGLPFHGGAGNNYVMNSIAAMVERVRADRGSHGLVTANGGYLTKHAAGIYSTNAPEGQWQREDPASYFAPVEDAPRPQLVEQPSGDAVIETWTVGFGRDGGPEMGLVIGRLGDGSDPLAPRFISRTPADADLLLAMTKEDLVGKPGRVGQDGELNIFSPAL